MQPLLLQWEWWRQGFYRSWSEKLSSITTESLTDMIALLHYPKEVILMLSEELCLLGSQHITIQQSLPYTIQQWKQALQTLTMDMEKLYGVAIEHRTIECLHALVEKQQKAHILGYCGNLEADLLLFGVRPQWLPLLQTLEQERIQYTLYPRSYFMIRHLFDQESCSLILLHKTSVQLILLQQGIYSSLHYLNTWWQDFYNMLLHKGIVMTQLDDYNHSSIQQSIIQESSTIFFEPIIKWIVSLSPIHNSCYIFSDIFKNQVLIGDMMQVIQSFHTWFIMPMVPKPWKNIQNTILENYLFWFI